MGDRSRGYSDADIELWLAACLDALDGGAAFTAWEVTFLEDMESTEDYVHFTDTQAAKLQEIYYARVV